MDNNNRDKHIGQPGKRVEIPKTDRSSVKNGASHERNRPKYGKDNPKTDRSLKKTPKTDFGRKKENAPRKSNAGVLNRPEQPLKAGTARDVALCALMNVMQNGAYASIALDRQLSQYKLSPEDRRLATSIFYLAAENRLRIEYALDRFLTVRPEPTVWDILNIAAAQILYMDRVPAHAAVDEAVKQVRASGREGLTGMVNGVLRNLVRARDAGETLLPDRSVDPVEYISVSCSLSAHIVRRLADAYGMEEAERIAAYRPTERVQTLRPNHMRLDADKFGEYLSTNGVKWRRGIVEDAFYCTGGGDLTLLDGYRQGLFSIQGESSMLAGMAVEAKRGMTVLDACAAPGGKSAFIAERLAGTGRVYAWDVHEHRVALLRAMGARLRLENLRPSVHDARRALDSLELSLDAVLVDAPCSGLGVIADKPDIKYRLTEANLAELVPLQRDILAACATHVKVGGLLVYSTCTVLPEENEQQVRAFLAEHPQFEPEKDVSYLPERFRPLARDGMLQLLQHRDGTEGFFIARMRRKRV